jgi:uncharacterized protein YciI
MAEYIYMLKVTRPEMLTSGPTIDEEQALDRHFRYLQEQLSAGKVIMFGRTQTTHAATFGLVVFEAVDDAEAEAFMSADPALAEGCMTAEVLPYLIAGMRQSS